jgi:hypothetical protein
MPNGVPFNILVPEGRNHGLHLTPQMEVEIGPSPIPASLRPFQETWQWALLYQHGPQKPSKHKFCDCKDIFSTLYSLGTYPTVGMWYPPVELKPEAGHSSAHL